MKILKNYTIEKKIDDEFSLLAKELSINKSQFVENKLKEFIKNNIELLNELKKQLSEK